jgi:hypothetical protein
MFMSNILVYFQSIQITFIYFTYLFLIQSPVPPCLQINAHDAYALQFGRSLYAWKDKEIIFSTQLVSWSSKFGVARNHRNKIIEQYPTNLQYFLSIKYSRRNYSSTWCTHKLVIISFHNELTTILAITYISLTFLYPINKFLSKYLLTTIPWQL